MYEHLRRAGSARLFPVLSAVVLVAAACGEQPADPRLLAPDGPDPGMGVAGGGGGSRPDKVRDLTVVASGPDLLTIQFTEVDDGTGNPARYDVRYHPTPMKWNWGRATVVSRGTCATPVEGTAVGAILTCTIEGLDASTAYDVRLVAYRGVMGVNSVYGPLSNVAVGTTAEAVVVTDVVASTDSLAFHALGRSLAVAAMARDAQGADLPQVPITWISTDEAVVVPASGAGQAVAVGVGNAALVASADCCALADTVWVTVDQVPAEVAVAPDSLRLLEGASAQAAAVVRDSLGSVIPAAPVTWASSDPTVATVDADGAVSAVGAGFATVTAEAANVAASLVVGVDPIPDPGTVQDLEVVSSDEVSLTVRFTQVDDGKGGPASYDIRVHDTPMGWNWGRSTTVDAGSCASPLAGTAAGEVLTCTIAGLASSSSYDVRLVSFRGAMGVNSVYGGLSNIATGVTADPGPVEVRATTGALAFAALGESLPLSAAALGANGQAMAGVALTWRSSDVGVVAFDPASAQATATGVGSAFLIVSADCCALSDTVAVDVTQVAAAIEVSPTSLSLIEGGAAGASATVRDALGSVIPSAPVSWTSSEPGVATVDAAGGITGITPGAATVTASSSGIDASVSVDVSPIPDPGTVDDLAVVATDETSLTVRFTQVDDGTGAPASYQLRIHATPMGWNWGSSTVVTEGACASPVAGTAPGETLTCTLEGLSPSSSYDVRLVSLRGAIGVNSVYGGLSNVATGVTDAPEIPAGPASLSVSPASVTLEVDGSQNLVAAARDAQGNLLTSATVAWSSTDPSVATVDADGQVRGVGRGTAWIRAVVDTLQASASVTVNEPTVVAGFNEPSGFSPIVERAFDSKAKDNGDRGTGTFPTKVGGSEGWDGIEYRESNLSIVAGGDPLSGGGAMRFTYPVGLPAGTGPALAQSQGLGSPTDLYVRSAVRLGPTYRVGSVSNKLYFHRMAGTPRAEPFLALHRSPDPTRFRLAVNFQGSPDNGMGWFFASGEGATLERERWYVIETLLLVNSGPGVKDGVFRVWVDGELVFERTDVDYLYEGRADAWGSLHVSPTYGGGGANTTEFWWDLGHAYVSGRWR